MKQRHRPSDQDTSIVDWLLKNCFEESTKHQHQKKRREALRARERLVCLQKDNIGANVFFRAYIKFVTRRYILVHLIKVFTYILNTKG